MVIFSIFFKMNVWCVFSLESLHRGDSSKYTQHTFINIKRKSPEISQNTIMSAAMIIYVKVSRTSSKQPCRSSSAQIFWNIQK